MTGTSDRGWTRNSSENALPQVGMRTVPHSSGDNMFSKKLDEDITAMGAIAINSLVLWNKVHPFTHSIHRRHWWLSIRALFFISWRRTKLKVGVCADARRRTIASVTNGARRSLRTSTFARPARSWCRCVEESKLGTHCCIARARSREQWSLLHMAGLYIKERSAGWPVICIR